MARWLIATLAFLGIGWLDLRYGHVAALVTMLVALAFIAMFGGHGRRDGPVEPPGDGPPVGR